MGMDKKSKINKMKIKFFCKIVLLCFCFFSCEKQKTMEIYSTEDVKCLKEILDTTLSDDVYCVLLHAANQNDVSIVDESIVMSSKNNALACYYMYDRIISAFDKMHVPIDSISNSIALMYLRRSADLGDEHSNRILAIRYQNGYGIKKDTCLFRYYISRSDSLRELHRKEFEIYRKNEK
jgi:hypothetical protein